MLEVASRSAVPVGFIAWPRYDGAATLIVKAAFDLRADGSVTLAATQPALSLDVRAPDGALLYPSDFVPHKPAIDVAIVGEEARPSASVATLSFGALHATAPHLGPIAAHDPRDTGWTSSEFDFARFQAAEPAQRLASLPLPARLSFSRGGLSLDQRVDLPTPSLMIVERTADGGSTEEPLHVGLTCDTLLVDPRARSLVAVFRGFAEPRGGWRPETLLVLNVLGRLAGIGPAEVAAWPRARVTRFEDRLLGGPAEGPAPIADPESSTLDSAEPPGAEDDMSSTVQAPLSPAQPTDAPSVRGGRRPAYTQPMSAADVARVMAAGAPEAAARSRAAVMAPQPAPRFGAPPQAPRAPEETEGYDGRQTMAISPELRASALPFVAGTFVPPSSAARGEPSAPPDTADDDPVGTGTLPVSAMSPAYALFASQAAAPKSGGLGARQGAAPGAGQTVPLPSLSREQIDRIRAELRQAPHLRRQILDRYALSEAVWIAIAGRE